MKVQFHKYQGTGNDFIIIDNRELEFPNGDSELISKLCNRNFGIGADGLILLENDNLSDFKMVYFNSDGNESSMCGNGGRCIAHFAQILKMINGKATFVAIDGIHHAVVAGNDVSLSMNDVNKIMFTKEYAFMNTGSPHYVLWCADLDALNIIKEARKIRYSNRFQDEGTNVNFLKFENDILEMRTYERGVEGETLSCGTGMVAAALFAFMAGKIPSKNECIINAKGGDAKVKFKQIDTDSFINIWLEGSVKPVFIGEIDV